ncbi:MAG: DMT family transporter [Ruminiclostridium sp.]|nr:DMT family transporter [Ruminiclostridium sp.]
MVVIAVIATALTGLTVILNRVVNSSLAQKIGLFRSTLYNYVTGLIVSTLFMLFSTETSMFLGITIEGVPFWAYFGGFIGVIVIVLSSYLTPQISAFYLTLLLFIGQLFTGIVIDFLNAGEFSFAKLIGGVFVFTGLAYNLFYDKKKNVEKAGKSET